MFQIEKQIMFKASHRLYEGGRKDETDHFHDWTICVSLQSPILDEYGFVYDYVILEKHLNDIADPIKNKSFNDIWPFNKLNPTAETIAKYFSDEIQQKLILNEEFKIQIVFVKVYKEQDIAIYYPS